MAREGSREAAREATEVATEAAIEAAKEMDREANIEMAREVAGRGGQRHRHQRQVFSQNNGIFYPKETLYIRLLNKQDEFS